jgi:hypothetical protein
MPVEIKELVIRAVVEPGYQQSSRASDDETSTLPQREFVQACVREVLRILKRSEER